MSLRETLNVEATKQPPRFEDDIKAPDWVPHHLVLLFETVMGELPAFPDRRAVSEVWERRIHRWPRRTLEAVPVPTRILNGRACFDGRRPIVEYGFRRLVNSPVAMGGRRPVTPD
jgi:hypothetical protein